MAGVVGGQIKHSCVCVRACVLAPETERWRSLLLNANTNSTREFDARFWSGAALCGQIARMRRSGFELCC